MFSKCKDFLYSDKTTLLILVVLIGIFAPLKSIYGLLQITVPSWISDCQQFGTYILLISLIWIHRANLRDYHIGKIAIWIFILSGTLFRVIEFSITNVLFWIFGICLLIFYIRGYLHTEPQPQPFKWLFF